MEWIRHSGWLGAVWFIVLYTLMTVVFLPASVLTVGAGAVYGFWLSLPLVTVSSTVGASASFLISRYIARDWIQRKLGHDTRYRAVERALVEDGWKIVMLSRLSPIVPHTLVSHAAGLTAMSFWQFTAASFVGFIPLSAAYVYAGAILGVAVRSNPLLPHDPLSATFYALGLAATVGVLVLMTRAASRAWRQRLQHAEKDAGV